MLLAQLTDARDTVLLKGTPIQLGQNWYWGFPDFYQPRPNAAQVRPGAGDFVITLGCSNPQQKIKLSAQTDPVIAVEGTGQVQATATFTLTDRWILCSPTDQAEPIADVWLRIERMYT